MTGNLLTLITAIASFGLGSLILQSLLARRVRVPVRSGPEETVRSREYDAQ